MERAENAKIGARVVLGNSKKVSVAGAEELARRRLGELEIREVRGTPVGESVEP